jgi:hypothetical protein
MGLLWPRRSGWKLDVHMEPFSTLAQILAPCAPGRGGGDAGMGLLWGLGAVEGDLMFTWNLSPPWPRSRRPEPLRGAAAAGQAAGPLGEVLRCGGASLRHRIGSFLGPRCSEGRLDSRILE